MNKISKADLADLKAAVELLEAPSITARLSHLIGSPIEAGVKMLPSRIQKKIHSVVEAALFKSIETALWGMKNRPHTKASTRGHKLLAAGSGALGGYFGLAALPVELPLSTTIMMRAVADVARSEGFDLTEFGTKLRCIEMFALGGRTPGDEATESGYYVVRSFMAEAVQHMGKTLSEASARSALGLVRRFSSAQTGDVLARLIQWVAGRFSPLVAEKIAAQAAPVVGAFTGAGINTLFTDYYQDMARGHFIVKRLEAKYTAPAVRAAYEALQRADAKAS